VFEDENPNLEAELQQLASALLANRLAPVRLELERLQATFAEVTARLHEQLQPTATPEEISGVSSQVQSWLNATTAKLEQDFQAQLRAELEQARAELSASMQQQFEADLQIQLEQHRQAIRREAETELEQLRSQIATLTDNQSLLQTANAHSLRR
jgi:hypothetical protein